MRTPGGEHKENWITGAQAAIAGGVSTVFDMPNTIPATTSELHLIEKKKLIDDQLKKAQIPLRYYLFLGATAENIDEIARCKNMIVGVKLFMGASTGNLQVANEEAQAAIFKECGRREIPLAIHAEDEAMLEQTKNSFIGSPTVFDHGKLRPREAALIALERAIILAEKYKTKLYSLHTSTKEEIDLIRQAKKIGISIFAEVTPHHLFLNETDLEQLENLGKMNPPLRTMADNDALWMAIHDGTIDTIGTDHAPHTLEEKNATYTEAPSGVPGIETYLPLLLNAYHEQKITQDEIIRLTRTNIQKIFQLPENNDTVTVDLDMVKAIQNNELKTKCKWSPFAGKKLIGWPILTEIKK
jgi:dihydroorotase